MYLLAKWNCSLESLGRMSYVQLGVYYGGDLCKG